MNTYKKYDLVFTGEIVINSENDNIKDIRDSIARSLKIREEQKAAFFSGKKIYLKKDSSHDEVLQLQHKLEKIRMKTSIVEKLEMKNDLSDDDLREISQSIPSTSEYYFFEYIISRESDENDLERIKPRIFSIFKGWKGRMNRKYYIICFLLALFCFGGYTAAQIGAPGAGVLFVLLGLWGMVNIVRFSILRLHDIGMSGWFTLLLLIPYLNFAFIFFLFVTPGVVGSNKFGKMG